MIYIESEKKPIYFFLTKFKIKNERINKKINLF